MKISLLLKYIDGMSDSCKTQLSAKSQEISENQTFLMNLLNEPATPLNPEEEKSSSAAPSSSKHVCSSVCSSSSSVYFGPLLDPALARLAVYSLNSKMGETPILQFESSIPPTPADTIAFSRYSTQVPSKISKTRRPQKVKFGVNCIVHLYNTDEDDQDRRSFIESKRFRNNYFLSPKDGRVY